MLHSLSIESIEDTHGGKEMIQGINRKLRILTTLLGTTMLCPTLIIAAANLQQPDPQIAKGNQLLAASKWEEAEQVFAAITQSEAKNAQAWMGLAEAKLQQKK